MKHQLEELKTKEKHSPHNECMTCGTEMKEEYTTYSYECERCINLADE